MARYDFDLLTIGAGSGGVAGSRRAASYGARVAIVEKTRVGGTCVLRGCVPKKLLVYGTHFAEELADAAGYGWEIDGARFDWAKLIAAKDRELDRLEGIYRDMLARAGVELIPGEARLEDPHTVRVGDKRVTAATILVATGGWPTVPAIPGIELATTSNEALDLPRAPGRVIIQGGGYIGLEFAGIFRAAGAEVDIVVRADGVLRGFDEELRGHLATVLAQKGIRVHAREMVTGITRAGDHLSARLAGGGTLEGDVVLFATGRAPNTVGLGLEEAGVRLRADGAIEVDQWSRSSVENIYAVGDVTNRVNLTPVAIAEARALAETLYNANPMAIDHTNVATAVFFSPPIGAVGLTEQQALALGHDVDLYTASFRPMRNILAGREERAFLKLVVDAESDRVLGCHMLGPDAPEIIQALAVAIKAGATKAIFDRTMALHPTLAEEFVTMRDRRRVAPAA